MMRHALPGLSNNWMVLLKTTALVSVIGLTDMVRVAAEASRATHEPFVFLIRGGGGLSVDCQRLRVGLRTVAKTLRHRLRGTVTCWTSLHGSTIYWRVT